jgi:hypothetical protein
MHSEESGDEEEEDDEGYDFGKVRMENFKSKARDILLGSVECNEFEYDAPMDLPGSYKALKKNIKNPPITHSKRPYANYMK